jgi:hypothetical protein
MKWFIIYLTLAGSHGSYPAFTDADTYDSEGECYAAVISSKGFYRGDKTETLAAVCMPGRLVNIRPDQYDDEDTK